MYPHHQKVSLWMWLILMRRKDLGPFQVFRKWRPKVCILEYAQILRLCSITSAHLAWLDRKVGLPQTAAGKKLDV